MGGGGVFTWNYKGKGFWRKQPLQSGGDGGRGRLGGGGGGGVVRLLPAEKEAVTAMSFGCVGAINYTPSGTDSCASPLCRQSAGHGWSYLPSTTQARSPRHEHCRVLEAALLAAGIIRQTGRASEQSRPFDGRSEGAAKAEDQTERNSAEPFSCQRVVLLMP